MRFHCFTLTSAVSSVHSVCMVADWVNDEQAVGCSKLVVKINRNYSSYVYKVIHYTQLG